MEADTAERKAIVVVEDSEPIADLIKETLNAEPDYQAVVVNDGSQALEVIRAVKASLILLDVGLPGLDGIQIYDLLQADAATQHIPIIFLTANHERAAFRDRAFANVIPKPFSLDDLLVAVAAVCRTGDGFEVTSDE